MKNPSKIVVGLLTLPLFISKLLSSTKKVKAKSNESDTESAKGQTKSNKESAAGMVVAGQTEHTQEAKASTENRRKQAKPTIRSGKRYERWQAFFTGIIAMLTLIYAATSIVQWRTMEESLQLSRQSLQVSQRAYLIVNDIQIDLELGQIKITLENIGHVPADTINIRISVVRRDEQYNPLEDVVSDYKALTDIFPGTFKPQIVYRLKNFTQEDAGLIREGKEGITVMVFIDYDSGFGSNEHSTFLFQYRPSPDEGWNMLLPWEVDDRKERLEKYSKEHPDEK